MNVYVYCLQHEYRYQSSILGRAYENEWFSLAPDGTVVVKGTNGKGYAWDGCSPKWKFRDMYFGTPEAVLSYTTRHSKTYYASLIHDVFYQFSPAIRGLVLRREVDREFLAILRRDKFHAALFYYWFVRAFGWMWWVWRR